MSPAIASLPDHVQHTLPSLLARGETPGPARRPGHRPVRGAPRKDATGSAAWDPDGIVQRAFREVRDELGDELVVIADLCLDEYTDHGHCGVLAADGSSTTTPRSSATARWPGPGARPALTWWRRAA